MYWYSRANSLKTCKKYRNKCLKKKRIKERDHNIKLLNKEFKNYYLLFLDLRLFNCYYRLDCIQ